MLQGLSPDSNPNQGALMCTFGTALASSVCMIVIQPTNCSKYNQTCRGSGIHKWHDEPRVRTSGTGLTSSVCRTVIQPVNWSGCSRIGGASIQVALQKVLRHSLVRSATSRAAEFVATRF